MKFLIQAAVVTLFGASSVRADTKVVVPNHSFESGPNVGMQALPCGSVMDGVTSPLKPYRAGFRYPAHFRRSGHAGQAIKAEEIVNELRQADEAVARSTPIADAERIARMSAERLPR